MIASGLHARTEHSVKNRWHSLIKTNGGPIKRGVSMEPVEEQITNTEMEMKQQSEQPIISSMVFWPP